jgi:hypothetical protein
MIAAMQEPVLTVGSLLLVLLRLLTWENAVRVLIPRWLSRRQRTKRGWNLKLRTPDVMIGKG